MHAVADRVTYRGTQLFLNDKPLHRVSAFGSSSSFNKEDLLELGSQGLVEIIDDIPNVDISLDVNEYGSIQTLNLLANNDINSKSVDFANDFENALVDFYITVRASPEEVWTQYIDKASVVTANYNFGVEGNFTERYSLQADNKLWFLNGAKFVVSREVIADEEGTISITFSGTPIKVLSVLLDDVRDEDVNAVIDGNDVIVTSADITVGTKVKVRVAGLEPNEWEKDKNSVGAKRRGHIEIYLLTDVNYNPSTRKIVSCEEHLIRKAQSLDIEASIDRDALKELGRHKVYARPMEYPMHVDATLEVMMAELDIFAKLAGKDISSANELSVDKFRKDLGLRVKIYERSDIEKFSQFQSRGLIKQFDIPYLIPVDSSLGLTLGENANQSFTFRSHELFVYDKVVFISVDTVLFGVAEAQQSIRVW